MTKNSYALKAFAALFYAFLLAPIVVVLLASITSANYVSFPPQGLSLRWYIEISSHPEFLSAFKISGLIACIVAPITTILSLSVGYALTQYPVPGASVWTLIFSSPLMLPGVLLGLGCLQFYSKLGITHSPLGLIVGHVIVTIPYCLRLLLIGFASMDPALLKAAQTLGASALRRFTAVVYPHIKPAATAGIAFAFLISFDDVAISLFLSRPGLVPVPIAVFNYLDQSFDPLVTAVSSVLIIGTAFFVVLLERLYGVGRLFGAGEAK